MCQSCFTGRFFWQNQKAERIVCRHKTTLRIAMHAQTEIANCECDYYGQQNCVNYYEMWQYFKGSVTGMQSTNLRVSSSDM
jgi:hypothetical protein